MERNGNEWNERVAAVKEELEELACVEYRVTDSEAEVRAAEAECRKSPTLSNRRFLQAAQDEHGWALEAELDVLSRIQRLGLPLVRKGWGPPGTLTVVERTWDGVDVDCHTFVTLTEGRWLVDGKIEECVRTLLSWMDID